MNFPRVMKRYNILAASLSSLFLVACVNEPENSKTKILSPEEETALNEYRAELELGRNMAGRLLQFFGQIDSEELIRYVNVVGNYVGSYSGTPERRYMFSVLNTESINAFACPGGYVLITKGALRLADNEAELAMILGHEVAHVSKQHMFRALQKMSKEELEKNAKDAENSGLLTTSMKVRKRPEPVENEAGSMIARYMAGSTGAGLNILQAAKAGMSVILDKGLDKDLEFEADNEGVRYGIKSGYEPNALYDYLGRLNKKSKPEDHKILSKTHPSLDDRQKRILAVLDEVSAKEIVGAARAQEFKKMQALLPAKK
jgi:predicted Zn-dependent protease